MTLVLDSAALIALERDDREMWAVLKAAGLDDDDVIVPATVLAQVWRGGSSRALLSRALRHCIVASFDVEARAVGELCGRAKTADICDAHVARVAVARGDVLYTGDVDDLQHLIGACRGRRPRVIRC